MLPTAIKNNAIVPRTTDTRCDRCGAILTAAESVRLHLGPVCRLVEGVA